MNIFGERIVLRAMEPEDSAMLFAMINDPETEMNLGGYSFPVSSTMQEKWIVSQQNGGDTFRCIIASKDCADVGFGTVILTDIDRKNGCAQIHIKLIPEARGKGIGTDAIMTMVRYSFMEQRLHCVYAEVLEYNTASKKLFAKCGFNLDGVMRGRVYKNGKYHNVNTYSILRND